MTRKDSEKDTDRPHYYSQYWLDVAAGRAVINAPKVEEEEELVETDLDMLEPEPTPLRKASRSAASVSDGYKSSRSHSVIEPAFVPDELAEPEENELEQDYEVDDLELPNLDLEETEEETLIPQSDFITEEEDVEEEDAEEEDEEDLFYDEEDEDEDEDSWGARGRKKPKPGRQAKAPKSSKKSKREPRRGF